MADADLKRPESSSSRDKLLNSDFIAKILGTDAMQMLRCGVCLEFFENPTVLPCGHTFCLHCLTEMCRHAATSSITPVQMRCLRVACPNCRVMIYASPILEKNVTCNFIVQSLLDCLRSRSPHVKEMTSRAPRTPVTPLTDQEVRRVTLEVDALLRAVTPRSVLDLAAWEVEEIRNQNIAESAKLKKALTGQRDPKPSLPEPKKHVATSKNEYKSYIPSFKNVNAFPAPPPDPPKCPINLSIAPPGNNCMLNLLPAPPGFKQAPIFVPQSSMPKHASSNANYNFNDINKYNTANNSLGPNRNPSSEKNNNHFSNKWNYQHSQQQNNETNIGNHDNNRTIMRTSRTVEVLPMKKHIDIPCNNNGGLSFNSFDQNRGFSEIPPPVVPTNYSNSGQNATTSGLSPMFGKYNTKTGFVPGRFNQSQSGFVSVIDKPEVIKSPWNIGGFGSVMGEELGYTASASDVLNSGIRCGAERGGAAGERVIGGDPVPGSKMGNVLQSRRVCAERLNNDPAIMSVVTSPSGSNTKPGF